MEIITGIVKVFGTYNFVVSIITALIVVASYLVTTLLFVWFVSREKIVPNGVDVKGGEKKFRGGLLWMFVCRVALVTINAFNVVRGPYPLWVAIWLIVSSAVVTIGAIKTSMKVSRLIKFIRHQEDAEGDSNESHSCD